MSKAIESVAIIVTYDDGSEFGRRLQAPVDYRIEHEWSSTSGHTYNITVYCAGQIGHYKRGPENAGL